MLFLDALKQNDINPRGHSIECRINAEDPSLNFQPSPGIIKVCHQPSGFRTRVDVSIFQGCIKSVLRQSYSKSNL